MRNSALCGDDAKAAIVLMAAVVLPLPQGAIIRLNASGTKLDASSTSYRYRLFFILRVCPPFVLHWAVSPFVTYIIR